jgi:hypothetical protein
MRPTEERLLAFLEGRAEETERAEILAALDADPELAGRLRSAAAGLARVRGVSELQPQERVRRPPAASQWRVAAAVAVTLLLSVPSTYLLTRSRSVEPVPPGLDAPTAPPSATGMPVDSDPSFVLVLHGTWPDAAELPASEGQARAREYWAWTSELAERGTLVAAGDLRWEPGARLGPSGATLSVAAAEVQATDFLVGMFALRVDSYEEALAVASECPHLRYGGSVSVRQVGSGFVTVPGKDDWSG